MQRTRTNIPLRSALARRASFLPRLSLVSSSSTCRPLMLRSTPLPTGMRFSGQAIKSQRLSTIPLSNSVVRPWSTALPQRFYICTVESSGLAKMPKNNLSFLNSTFPKARLNKPTIRIVPQNKRNYQTAAEAPSTQSWIILGGLAALGIVGLAVAGSMRKPAAITTVDDFAQKRLRATYGYVAGGLATTALASVYMFNFGVARRIVLMNPWLLLGVSLFGTIGTMMAMYAIPKERKVARHVAWMAFNLCTGATLSPLGFLGGPVIMKAMLGTGAVVGGLSLIAATAPDDTFLWMGGPLGLGLGVLLAASLGQMFFPTSAFLTNVTLYGGLGLFGLMVLYDTQRVKERAKIAPATQSPEGEDLGFDPMTESLGVYLDTINIFIRMAQIMAGAGQRSRK